MTDTITESHSVSTDPQEGTGGNSESNKEENESFLQSEETLTSMICSTDELYNT